jgi:hypothetical protein
LQFLQLSEKEELQESAKVKKRKLTLETRIDIKRIGFLPRLSDSLPSIGEKMNCITQNAAVRIPIQNAPTLKVSA